MKKNTFQLDLSVLFLKEKERFVAYAPALDLSTSGKTFEEARRRFGEATNHFFEEIDKRGTANEVLKELGWHKARGNWQPPLVVSQHPETVQVEVSA